MEAACAGPEKLMAVMAEARSGGAQRSRGITRDRIGRNLTFNQLIGPVPPLLKTFKQR